MQIPEEIKKIFEQLKSQFEFTIVLRNIKGHFYVYKAMSWWDKKDKRVKSSQDYLGRITGDGIFVRREASHEEIEFERAKSIIKARGYVINPAEHAENIENEGRVPQETSETDKKILTYLSMNSRAPVSAIAKFANLSVSAVQYRIKHLEETYGIKYMLEFDITKLGYITLLALVKFVDKMPSAEELRSAFFGEAAVQFAAITKGEYDLVLYMVADTNRDIEDDVWRLRSETILRDYECSWYTMPFSHAFSFVPLRDAFVDKLDPDLHKSRQEAKENVFLLKRREFLVLKELNKNSAASFSEIDQKHNLGKGAARYAYLDLLKKNIILRPTISINPKIKYLGIIHLETINALKTLENRHYFWLDIVSEQPLVDKYALVGNIGAPAGTIWIMPVFNEDELNLAKDFLQEAMKENIFKTLVIVETILGNLCFRRSDMAYTRSYQSLLKLGKVSARKRVDYGL